MRNFFNHGLTTGGTDVFSNNGIYLEFFHIASRQRVKFKAFITNFQETFDTSFETADVYGRLDPIQIYKGTKRTISLGWDVIAETEQEAYQNLKSVQSFIQMMYPRYNDYTYGNSKEKYEVSVLGAPPLVKIKFMNLIGDAATSYFYKVKEESENQRIEAIKDRLDNDPLRNLPDALEPLFDPLKDYGDGGFNRSGESKSRLVTFKYNHGNVVRNGLLAAPGGLTVNNNITEDGSLIRKVNCGVVVLPIRISLANTFTILHEHDLGYSAQYDARKGKVKRRRGLSGGKFAGRFPYGTITNVQKKKK